MNKYQRDVSARYWQVWAESLAHCATLIRQRQRDEIVHQATTGELQNSTVVSPKLFTWQVAYLLWGLSLENLVKQLLIRQDPSLVTPTGLQRSLLTHDLSKLFAWADLSLSEAEAKAIATAATATIWSGKYPHKSRATDPEENLLWRSSDLDEVLPSLYTRLLAIVNGTGGEAEPQSDVT
jgi:hypothetical protein